MELYRDVLDEQAVDRTGERMGKIDGILLDVPDGEAPRVAALEIGVVTAVRRLHIGWLTRFVERRAPAPLRVPVTAILEIGLEIKLDVDAETTTATALERWLRERVVCRVPGNGSTPIRRAPPARGSRAVDGDTRAVRVEALAGCRVVDPRGRMAGRLAGIEVAARGRGYVVESFVIDHHPLLNRVGAWTVPREILAALPFTRPGSHRVRWQDVDLSDAARPRLRVAASRVTRAPAEAA